MVTKRVSISFFIFIEIYMKLMCLISSSNISAGNTFSRIAGRLGHKIISLGMNDYRFTNNIINGKTAVEKCSPCVALIG